MIDAQVPVEFWGEAVNTANYLHRLTPNNGLIKRDDRDGYEAPYNTPHEMLHAYGKPRHDAKGKDISYKAPTDHLRRFGCYVSKLIPKAKRGSKFSPKSKLGCMMVGYVHDSTTTWRIWDPDFKKVNTQSDVIFDEERNVYVTCSPPPANEESTTDLLGLKKEEVHVEELEKSGGEGIGNPKDGHDTANNQVIMLRHGHNQNLHCNTSDRGRACQHRSNRQRAIEKNAQNLEEDLQTPNLTAGMDRTVQMRVALQTPGLPVATDPSHNSMRITRSMAEVIASDTRVHTAEADVMVSALMSTAIDGDPNTYEEAMASDEKELWKVAIREECTSIIRNKTFTPTDSISSRPIGSKWVFKTKRNPDGTIRHKVRLVIKGYCYTFRVTSTILTVGAALHLRIPPALKTGPRLTALLPAYHIYPLGQRTPRLSTGPKEAERQHQLVANRASIAVTIQAHKSMLRQATNTNQNNKEGNKNKKHKKGNKDSNKSWRYSDSIMKDGKRRENEGRTMSLYVRV